MMESSLTGSMEVCASACLHMRVHARMRRRNRYTAWETINVLAPALTHALKWVILDSADIWSLTSLVTQLFDIRWGLQEHGSSKEHRSWNLVSVSYSLTESYHLSLNADRCPLLSPLGGAVCSGCRLIFFFMLCLKRWISKMASASILYSKQAKMYYLVEPRRTPDTASLPCLNLFFNLKKTL